MALCTTGKYLISQNLATMLYMATKSTDIWVQDITVISLLLLANLAIWSPAMKEFETTKIYKRFKRNEL